MSDFYVKTVFVLLFTLWMGRVSGQDTPVLEGRVTDSTGQPLSGVTVKLPAQNKGSLTDENGVFRFTLTPGNYMLDISRVGFGSKTLEVRFDRERIPVIVLEEKVLGLNEVVITATRTEKNVADLPLPVTIVGKAEIQQKAMVRLNEVLAEQPGIVLVQDHGTGIQLQGFEAKYTLILIDGEPVVGRSSGTLELSRITLANVERIEILKGPSSSLYGSEAMAGVINIITKKPAGGHRMGVSVRYGTNHALDMSLDGSMAGKKASVYGAFNRFSNRGYNYGAAGTSSTVPPFHGYTAHVKADYKLTSKLELKLGMKYNDEHALDRYLTNTGAGDEQNVSSRFLRKDIAFTPGAVYRHSDKHTTFLRIHQSFYKTETRINVADDGSLFNHDYFDQHFSKAELQHDYKISTKVQITAGAGMTDEWLKAVRYDDKKEFVAGFGYLQADVKLSGRLNFISGGRFDTHSVYASQFSPKLAAQYKTFSWLTVHGTIGRGFKAPDFRELYLNWTNPTQGYSVFGAEDAAHKLNQLVAAGEISEVLFNPDRIKALDAERSWNYQAGLKLHPGNRLEAGMSLFRNHVSNLIETFIIATKTNGKSVYTYSNQENVIIEGVEIHAAWKWKDLNIKTGGQYLYAVNKDVLKAIEAGKGYYTRDASTGSSRLVKSSEYGGLFNRSRYTAHVSTTWNRNKPGVCFTFRWMYRGRFGMRDIDGNGILNQKEEYTPGYSLFNASAVKSFFRNRLSVSLSTENIGNITHTGVATMPGRMFFIGAAYKTK